MFSLLFFGGGGVQVNPIEATRHAFVYSVSGHTEPDTTSQTAIRKANTSDSYFPQTCATRFINSKSRECVATAHHIRSQEFTCLPLPLVLAAFIRQFPLSLDSYPWSHVVISGFIDSHSSGFSQVSQRQLVAGCPLATLRTVPGGLCGILMCFSCISTTYCLLIRHSVVVSFRKCILANMFQPRPCFSVSTMYPFALSPM